MEESENNKKRKTPDFSEGEKQGSRREGCLSKRIRSEKDRRHFHQPGTEHISDNVGSKQAHLLKPNENEPETDKPKSRQESAYQPGKHREKSSKEESKHGKKHGKEESKRDQRYRKEEFIPGDKSSKDYSVHGKKSSKDESKRSKKSGNKDSTRDSNSGRDEPNRGETSRKEDSKHGEKSWRDESKRDNNSTRKESKHGKKTRKKDPKSDEESRKEQRRREKSRNGHRKSHHNAAGSQPIRSLKGKPSVLLICNLHGCRSSYTNQAAVNIHRNKDHFHVYLCRPCIAARKNWKTDCLFAHREEVLEHFRKIHPKDHLSRNFDLHIRKCYPVKSLMGGNAAAHNTSNSGESANTSPSNSPSNQERLQALGKPDNLLERELLTAQTALQEQKDEMEAVKRENEQLKKAVIDNELSMGLLQTDVNYVMQELSEWEAQNEQLPAEKTAAPQIAPASLDNLDCQSKQCSEYVRKLVLSLVGRHEEQEVEAEEAHHEKVRELEQNNLKLSKENEELKKRVNELGNSIEQRDATITKSERQKQLALDRIDGLQKFKTENQQLIVRHQEEVSKLNERLAQISAKVVEQESNRSRIFELEKALENSEVQLKQERDGRKADESNILAILTLANSIVARRVVSLNPENVG